MVALYCTKFTVYLLFVPVRYDFLFGVTNVSITLSGNILRTLCYAHNQNDHLLIRLHCMIFLFSVEFTTVIQLIHTL